MVTPIYQFHMLKTPGDIRLLRILPKHQRESYEIVTASLADPPSFEAISYAWGEGRSSIICSYVEERWHYSESIKCPKNCCAVLERLRKRKDSRLVWVDSICINQGDEIEKSKQVAIMDQIYRKARCVLVWLGDGRGFESLAMAAIRRYQVAISIHPRVYKNKRVKKWIHGTERPLSNESFSDITDKCYVQGVQQVLHSTWFERVWTLQEVAVAKECLVYCGNAKPVSWDFFCRFLGTISHLKAFSNSVGRIEPHKTARTITQSDLNTIKQRSGSDSAIYMLRLNRQQKATVMIDKVYAQFKLIQYLGVSLPVPNYTLPHSILLKDVAKSIILQTKSLALLHDASCTSQERRDQPKWLRRPPELPLWVPTWSARNIQTTLPLPDPALFRATRESPPLFNFHINGTVLQVRGAKTDEVKFVSETAHFSSDSYDTDEIALVFARWFNLAMRQRPYPSGCLPSSAFIRTILQGQLDASEVQAAVGWLEPFLDCQNEFTIADGYEVCKTEDSIPFEEYARKALCSKKESLGFEDIDRYLRPLKEYYDSPSGCIVLSESYFRYNRVRTYSSFVGVPGLSCQAFKYRPFHLRLCKSISSFTFFVTKKGYMGITEGLVRVGDTISLISGLSKPVIVELSREGDSWELIGTCYVHGMMNGEYWKSDEELGYFDLI